jgi:competence protein ComFC
MAPPYTEQRFLVKLYHYWINQFFPSECLVCGKEGEWLCAHCHTTSIAIKSPTCPFCDRLSPLGKTCSRCRKDHPLSGGRSIWYYNNSVKKLIHSFKYQKVTSCQEFITPFLIDLYQEIPLAKHEKIIITSVPSSREHLNERGFNQSEILALSVSRTVKHPYTPLLSRKPNSQSQTALTRKERLANVQGQFSLQKRIPNLEGYTVVIVDDVITTGATLTSCAALLRQAGAKHIWGLTVAKD